MSAAGPPQGRFDLARIEEAGLNAADAAPALLRRLAAAGLAGKAKRARSVNAHFGSTLPLAAKIAWCERLYAEHGLPPLFRMTPFNQPADLEDALARAAISHSRRRSCRRSRWSARLRCRRTTRRRARHTGCAHVRRGRGRPARSTAQQRDAHRGRLANSPLQKRFAVVSAGGRVVCTAQVAVEDGLAGVFDVVTADDARGKGHATLACASLLSWAWQHGANIAYLQVSADNAPALAIYRKFGFATVYTYHYRGQPGRCE
jgi:RimJ/RimL family protein N-acetyltransferase